MSGSLVLFLYLVATVCFIFGLKKLASPKSAPTGNLLGAIGMAIAVLTTLVSWEGRETNNLPWILIALVGGAGVGGVLAKRIQMTAMPQLVAAFNGFGGLASAIVALGEVMHWQFDPGADSAGSAAFGILIGCLTFTGSIVAFAKLQGLKLGGLIQSGPMTFPGQQLLNGGAFALAALFTFLYTQNTGAEVWPFLIVPVALALGYLATIPIGGADMPVVIALLNSFSGIAASAAGFVTRNPMLIVAGALVGASGIILTVIMCKGMNRSLANVLFAAFGTGDDGGGPAVAGGETRTVRNYTPEDGAILLANARSVIVVPGYGLAVAQAQHNVRELCDLIEKNGADIKYAIHPVAGRMPGHMNVLLAEANVPYNQLLDLDEVNPYFENADVALVVGANDVVNPGARTDTNSPIYGMPILDADKARNVIILKRSLGTGFAGTGNELFFDDKTMMLFGDAKDTILKLIAEVKAL